jgi:hypothetical protein
MTDNIQLLGVNFTEKNKIPYKYIEVNYYQCWFNWLMDS